MAQSTHVGIVIRRLMRCTVVESVVSNFVVSASIAVGVIVTKSTFDDIELPIVVAVQIQVVDFVSAISVHGR